MRRRKRIILVISIFLLLLIIDVSYFMNKYDPGNMYSVDESGDFYWLDRINNDSIKYRKKVFVPTMDNNGHIVKRIGGHAISGSDTIEKVVIGDNIRWLSEFSVSFLPELKTVKIGKNVEDIGFAMFSQCPKLESLQIDSDNPYICCIEGAIYSKDEKTLLRAWNSIEYISDTTEIIVNSAFFGVKGMELITIPNGVREIGADAFQNCTDLKSVYVPSSVTYIGNTAFCGCDNLTVFFEEGTDITNYSQTWNCSYYGRADINFSFITFE